HPADLVVGLARPHARERRPEPEREPEDPDAERLGGDEVAELVDGDEEPDHEKEVDDRQTVAMLSCRGVAPVAAKIKSDDSEINVEEVLGELENKLDRLKVLYEQYFMGIEKLEPQTQRKEVTRRMLELAQIQIRNTAMRYRYHALNQKFGAYQT